MISFGRKLSLLFTIKNSCALIGCKSYILILSNDFYLQNIVKKLGMSTEVAQHFALFEMEEYNFGKSKIFGVNNSIQSN